MFYWFATHKAAFYIPSKAEKAMILGLATFWGKLDICHKETWNNGNVRRAAKIVNII